MSIADPTNVIAAHTGNGVVQIHVDHPTLSLVKYFEVASSDSLSGDYFGVGNSRFAGEDGFVYGFTPGRSIYMKVRAIGADNTVSNWVQVKAAVVSRATVVMQVSGIEGSMIPAESLFCCKQGNSRIFGVKNLSEINF